VLPEVRRLGAHVLEALARQHKTQVVNNRIEVLENDDQDVAVHAIFVFLRPLLVFCSQMFSKGLETTQTPPSHAVKPETSGWLMKRGGGGLKNWMKRWMELEDTKLLYFKRKGGQWINFINLEEVFAVKVDQEQRRGRCCFSLETSR
jgi:hypothetical protein